MNRLLNLVLCLALILSLTPMTAWADGVGTGQVVADGTPTSATGAANATSVSFAHTTGSGSDRLLLVGLSWNCGSTDRTVASATFTPTSGPPIDLTLVKKQQAGTQLRYSAIYSLLNPSPSTLGTVTITFSGAVSNGIVAGAASFAGVDQANPLGLAAGAGSPSQTTTPSVMLTGLEGDELVFDAVFLGGSSSSQTLTAGGGQNQLWNAFSSNTRSAASTEQATSSSVTMSWTAASNGYWAIAAVPINPAAALPTDIAGATIAPIADQTYTGSAITPALTVTLGADTLVKDADYTVGYSDNTNAGTASVTVTGIGAYTGTKGATFTILKATPSVTWPSASAITLGQALSASTLSGGTHSVPGSFVFTTPAFVPLVTGPYTAAVTFAPTDSANYDSVGGTVEVQVDPPLPTDLAGATIAPIPNQTYTGSAITPAVTVTLGADTLVKDTDYTVGYSNNTNAGTASVTITGIGAYSGTKGATFTILKATPSVTWPSASAITLGQALSASTLSGGTHSVPGSFVFTTLASCRSRPGSTPHPSRSPRPTQLTTTRSAARSRCRSIRPCPPTSQAPPSLPSPTRPTPGRRSRRP